MKSKYQVAILLGVPATNNLYHLEIGQLVLVKLFVNDICTGPEYVCQVANNVLDNIWIPPYELEIIGEL